MGEEPEWCSFYFGYKVCACCFGGKLLVRRKLPKAIKDGSSVLIPMGYHMFHENCFNELMYR